MISASHSKKFSSFFGPSSNLCTIYNSLKLSLPAKIPSGGLTVNSEVHVVILICLGKEYLPLYSVIKRFSADPAIALYIEPTVRTIWNISSGELGGTRRENDATRTIHGSGKTVAARAL